MSLVDGVGGAFIFSDDPERLAGWYRDHLGIEFDGGAEFGSFYIQYLAKAPKDTFANLALTAALALDGQEPKAQEALQHYVESTGNAPPSANAAQRIGAA